MITLTFDIPACDPFKAGIQRFTEDISDLTPAWEDIRDYFWEVESEQFDSEGAAGADGAWAQLSARYAAWKEKNYGSLPILMLTGELRASLTGTGGAATVEIAPMRLHVGSDVFYGIFHQFGTSQMPQRKPIDLTYENQIAMMKIIQGHLVVMSERAGIPAP